MARSHFSGLSRRRVALLVAALALIAAACGGSGSDGAATTAGGDGAVTTTTGANPATTAGTATTAATTAPSSTAAGGDTTTVPPTTAPGGAGTCTVVVTGDMEAEWTAPQSNASFSTDYWFSEDDLRATVEFLGEEAAGGTYDELVARGEPIVTLFSLNCSDPDDPMQGALALPTNGTVRSDLPMAPGRYEVVGGLFDADSDAGVMLADLTVAGDALFQTVSGSGTVEITRWDASAVEGGFSFDATEMFVDDDPMEIRVEVSFSFACRAEFLHSGCG